MMNTRVITAGISSLAVVIGITLSCPAPAAKNPIDYRRTLFVPAGQKTLVFEAPQGMCFLDTSLPFEEALYKAFQGMMQKNGDQVLLAVFADCNNIAGLTGTSGTNNIPLNAGVIAWLNGPIGETTALSRTDYLDMRESAFRQYARNSPLYSPKFHLDDAAHRTGNGVSLAMSGEIGMESAKQKGSVMLAATTIRHMPIEFMIRYTGADPPALEKTYLLMDKFIAQQIALNE